MGVDPIYVKFRRVMAPEWLTQLLYDLAIRSVLRKSREKRWDSVCRSICTIASRGKRVRGLSPYGVAVWKETQGGTCSTRGRGRKMRVGTCYIKIWTPLRPIQLPHWPSRLHRWLFQLPPSPYSLLSLSPVSPTHGDRIEVSMLTPGTQRPGLVLPSKI